MSIYYTITTLGCKVNQSESESLAASLKSRGMSEAGSATADVCIINTCTVTQKASMQSRQAIRRSIRLNPQARIIVTGCYAQMQPEQIRRIDKVDDIIGHRAKMRIPDLIKTEVANEDTSAALELPFCNIEALPADFSRTRPVLKIQDGCNTFCTYCIVPYARGRSRSMPVKDVSDAVNAVHSSGKREIVLAGIHLGCYGQELTPSTSLVELLNYVLSDTSIERIRLSSIEPAELTSDIITLASESERLCSHFHIPLQSGDDSILERMHRPYTRSMFSSLIRQIHAVMPDAAIGADILAGFPGETEAAFENTFTLVEELPISYLHVFPFSARKGTPAYTFPDKVADNVIKARCRRLRELGKRKKNEFYQKFIHQKIEILVESQRDRRTGLLKGFTSNYIPVLVQAGDELKNKLVMVRIERVDADGIVFGRIL
ncbi:tRNA (N(6)-L-threonylcarbamoyladenosine(37)-C(2))-methylthiotransferase MtaB [Desulfococcaceae bacterium HSG9]|nr:tRNA (N(6)-L-threonylcarbamoyladenosine(37)-C(2))-methylthiotransferase MtaB [Desulfococcaceae bacterium HSG9]